MLSLDLRPKTFQDVVGQDLTVAVLRAIARSGNPPALVLFHGLPGTGKTSCARIFAAALNCSETQGDACGSCSSCQAVYDGRSTYVVEIDAASHGGVDDIRALKELCYTHHSGEFRVVVLDEAHSLTTHASNALLKLTEEPPPNTVFVLVTTSEERILGTLRSRAMPFLFSKVSPVVVANLLESVSTKYAISADSDLCLRLASESTGVRDAINALEKTYLAGVTSLDSYLSKTSTMAPDTFFFAVLTSDPSAASQFLRSYFERSGDYGSLVGSMTSWLVSVLEVQTDSSRVCDPKMYEFARLMSAESVSYALSLLWDLETRLVSSTVPHQSHFMQVFSMLSSALAIHVPKRSIPVVSALDEQEASLDFIRQMLDT